MTENVKGDSRAMTQLNIKSTHETLHIMIIVLLYSALILNKEMRKMKTFDILAKVPVSSNR